MLGLDARTLDECIKIGINKLLTFQNSDGAFSSDVDFSIWADAGFLILQDELKLDIGKSELVKGILERQNIDGSWGPISEASEGDFKSTIFAYRSIEKYISQGQKKKIEKWLENYEGSRWVDPYTEMLLVKKNEQFYFPPPEMVFIPLKVGKFLGYLHMLFPKVFKWSIFLFPSAWTRNAFPQLQVVGAVKTGKNKGFLRKTALRKLEKQILSMQLRDGSWFKTILPTIGSIYALHLLGYKNDWQEIKRGLAFLESCIQKKSNRLNRFDLKIWNTALATCALFETSKYSSNAVKKGVYYLLRTQSSYGGWGFTSDNGELTDNDDTSLVLMALAKAKVHGYKIFEKCIEKAIEYLLSNQNKDGGWAAFDKNQSRKKPGLLPPYHVEYGHELKDPSTADVSGHAISALADNGYSLDSPQIKKAIKWIESDAVFGSWYGRWGLCYIYGTSRVLIGLGKLKSTQRMKCVDDGLKWLAGFQNYDGGWGEHYSSYYSRTPIGGKSTVVHTCWAVLSFLENDHITYHEQVERGISYLIKQQGEGGILPGAYTAAAIEPADYYIYPYIFFLQVMAKYKKILEKK
ncbi:squalene cyclase [Ruminiclostridium sufflavum DSM 19573]|uniref:Squalene cyclase n=1 Tax=Ruminiclostridium sufflavum DSM 19573 TaxID=1121337 RepID=A0A318XKQ6_9FIRM|nr:prenyltransferase/squalene oxidase repeat-containing protein [Ruminiclostridium sufflavum]PYG88025.1 squalene cyclase [Ruminiclostridium sufflavum DSM 19573]